MQEMELRKELQIQLQQSEGKLQRLEQGVKSGKHVFENDGNSLGSNERNTTPGRSMNAITSIVYSNINYIYNYCLSAVVGETLHMQIPKESDARKKGWCDVVGLLIVKIVH